MPSAEMTVQFWPLRTRGELVDALWDILDNVPGAGPDIVTGYEGGAQKIFLHVVADGGVPVPEAPLGSVVVKAGTVWEVITVAEAENRSLPLPELLDTAET